MKPSVALSLVVALSVGVPAVSHAQSSSSMKGMDMKGMDMKGMEGARHSPQGCGRGQES